MAYPAADHRRTVALRSIRSPTRSVSDASLNTAGSSVRSTTACIEATTIERETPNGGFTTLSMAAIRICDAFLSGSYRSIGTPSDSANRTTCVCGSSESQASIWSAIRCARSGFGVTTIIEAENRLEIPTMKQAFEASGHVACTVAGPRLQRSENGRRASDPASCERVRSRYVCPDISARQKPARPKQTAGAIAILAGQNWPKDDGLR